MVRLLRYQVLKVRRHVGPAKVFDSEEDAIQAVLTDEIVDGDVVVSVLLDLRVVLVCLKCCHFHL